MADAIASVTDRMVAQCDQWVACGDCREVFLRCYSMMTGNMLRALDAGEFRDAAWVAVLLRRFADYYFHALAAYEAQRADTPRVWRTAHEATCARQGGMLQHLLLGVNAHINYDLVLALYDALEPEWAHLTDEGRGARQADHRHVNLVIARTIDAVQDELLEPRAPALDVVDVMLGPVDEWLISRLITRWRDRVWHDATAMLSMDDADTREAFRRRVEAATERRAEAILLHGGLPALRHLLD